MVVGIVVLAIVAVVVGWFISTSNSVNRMIVKIDESKSDIEIQLKKRFDVLTQSMNIAKGFVKHENEIFNNLHSVKTKMSVDEINETVSNQNEAMSNLLALGEAYPELKSAELFSNLQKQLTEENAQFAASKRAFNANVAKLNGIVVSFPNSIVCNIKGQKRVAFIKEDNVEEMKNVDMEF